MKNYANSVAVSIYSCYLILILNLLCIFSVQAQCPTSDLILPATVCINENFKIENNSTGATSYEWDFCPNDVFQLPNQQTITENSVFNRITSVKMVKSNGKWYGFAVSGTERNIIRLLFDDDLDSILSIESLGGFGVLNRPYDIDIIDDNGDWLAVVTDLENSTLNLLNFGNSLDNSPSIEVLGDFGVLNQPRSIELRQDGGNWIGVICNRGSNKVTLINWGNSILNSVSPQVINSNIGFTLTENIGIDVIETASGWYGITCSNSNGRVYKLKFGNQLFSQPTATLLSTVTAPFGISLVEERGKYVAFVSGYNGQLYRFNFNSDMENNPSAIDVSDNTEFPRRLNFDIIRNKGARFLFSADVLSNRLDKLVFEGICDQSIDYSNEEEPEIAFFSLGQKRVLFSMINNNCRVDTTVYFEVNEDIAPSIDIDIDNLCITSGTKLSLVTEDLSTILSREWNIVGDIFNDSEVTYNFPSAGTYEITLEVESTNGCGNQFTKEITIYEPPAPNFSIPSGQICTNGTVSFTNTTDAKGADSLITYQWFLDGELVSEVANPDIIFTEGGTKTLRLAASIPDCTETFEQTIDVLQGPTVRFSLPPQMCEGESITLENETSGDNITNYEWSFGDGGSLESTTAEAVSYTFAEAGTYDISLTANTSLGCANVSTQTVTVYEQPTVGFTSDVACVGAITQFTDTSSAGSNANIIAWNWDFGDGLGTAHERNPAYTFSAPGTYTVELTTQSSGGCTATATQTITVETSVSAGFSVNQICPTEADPFLYQFTDESTVVEGEKITQRLWSINGENFVEETVTYAFSEPGTYEVSLTAFASSGCNATSTQSVTVDALPEIRFQAATGCVGEPIQLTNISQLNGWELTQYAWEIPEIGPVYEESPTVIFPEAGEYSVVLNLETKDGCTFSWDSAISILPAPQAVFEIDQLSGGTPLTVQPLNQSTDYTSVQWSINGSQVSEETAPSFTLEELGTYEIALIVQNDIGCADTALQTVEVVNPRVDLSVVELVRVANSSSSDQLVLTLENRGTVTIDTVEIQLSLGNVVSLKEQILEPLLPGERRVYPLQTTLGEVRNQQTPVEFVCATVNVLGQSISEADVNNNRGCVALTAPVLVEAPFPNPARDEVVFSVVLEEPEVIQVDVISASGERVHSEQIPDTQSGLNTIRVNVSQTPAGVYTLEIRALGQTINRRVIVNP
jgi:PKD repeat protein